MTCQIANCEIGPADWIPVLVIYAPEECGPHDPIHAQLGLRVCLGHVDTLTVPDVLSDEGWAQIVALVVGQGKAAPDRSRVRLEFCGWRGSRLQRVNQHRNG